MIARRCRVGTGTQPGGLVDQLEHGQPGEAGPDRLGAAEAQLAHLVERGGALVAGRAAGHDQDPHRLHRPVAVLGPTRRRTRQRRPGGGHGVDRVGLAVTVTSLAVGAVNLDDLDPGGPQEPGQAGPVGTGALHADPDHLAEAAQPAQQLGIAALADREGLHPQDPAVAVDRRGDMNLEVGVDPAAHHARLYDGHRAIPSVGSVLKGWHALAGTADLV